MPVNAVCGETCISHGIVGAMFWRVGLLMLAASLDNERKKEGIFGDFDF